MAEHAPFAPRPYRAVVRYRVAGKVAELALPVDPGSGSGSFEASNGDLALDLRIEGAPDALCIDSAVTGRRTGVELDLIEPLVLEDRGLRAKDVRFLHNGWQSWSGSSGLCGDALEPRPVTSFLREVVVSPFAPRLRGPGHLSSELFTAVSAEPSGAGLVAGFTRAASQFGGFELDLRDGARARLAVRLPFEGVPLAPGERRAGEPLVVRWGESVPALLDDYAARLGHEMSARVPPQPTAGWCSWYEYFTRIDERAVLANLSAAEELRDRLSLDLFQIDDGYQAAIGDWLDTNAKFPRGMGPLADAIAARGFTPGLWLAPFLVRPESRLGREHPGWLVRDDRGRPRRGMFNPAWSWRDVAWVLDVTHPGAAEHLARTCEALARELGFRFLKLDFLFAAALPGRRHDRRLTGAEALRRGLELVRRAVGDDVHLLGCGCPLGPAIGIVDSMRIGADVAPFWRDLLSRVAGRDYEFPATRNALRNTLVRAPLHRRLWRNDPDCLLVRDRRTRLTRDEVIALATAIALSGGTFLLSDELRGLAADRLEIARRALAIQREIDDAAPWCPDLMRPGSPRLLAARRRAGGVYVGVLNLDDRPARVEVALAQLGPLRAACEPAPASAREVWTAVEYRMVAQRIDLGEIPAHGARLLAIEGPTRAPAAASEMGR